MTTSDEDNKKLTKFVQSVWNRIEPDEKGWWDTHKPVNAAAKENEGNVEQGSEGTSEGEGTFEVSGVSVNKDSEPKKEYKPVSNWVPSNEETFRPKPGEGISTEKGSSTAIRENTRWADNDSKGSTQSAKDTKEEDNPYDFWDSL